MTGAVEEKLAARAPTRATILRFTSLGPFGCIGGVLAKIMGAKIAARASARATVFAIYPLGAPMGPHVDPWGPR